jgi:hypothetical protein
MTIDDSNTGLILDEYVDDPSEWRDTDGDYIGDNSDKFPEDPSASLDSDDDGHPDEWNDGKTSEDSTSNLKLDHYPEDSEKWKEEKSDSNLLMIIIVILFVVAILIGVAIFFLIIMKKNGSIKDTENSRIPGQDSD